MMVLRWKKTRMSKEQISIFVAGCFRLVADEEEASFIESFRPQKKLNYKIIDINN